MSDSKEHNEPKLLEQWDEVEEEFRLVKANLIRKGIYAKTERIRKAIVPWEIGFRNIGIDPKESFWAPKILILTFRWIRCANSDRQRN